MKKTILSLLSFALPAVWLGAALPQPLVVSSDLTYASQYVFRGIELADDSFQPTLEGSVGDFYAGLWANLPTDADGSEIDYYGGYQFVIPGLEAVSFDAGLTIYHYPNQNSDRTHELYLGGAFGLPDVPAMEASLYYFYDMDIHSHVAEAAVTYSQSLEGAGLPSSLDLSVVGGVQGGTEVKTENYNYYGVSAELPYALTDYSTLTAGVHYATAEKVTFGPSERGKNLFWTIGYSTSF